MASEHREKFDKNLNEFITHLEGLITKGINKRSKHEIEKIHRNSYLEDTSHLKAQKPSRNEKRALMLLMKLYAVRNGEGNLNLRDVSTKYGDLLETHKAGVYLANHYDGGRFTGRILSPLVRNAYNLKKDISMESTSLRTNVNNRVGKLIGGKKVPKLVRIAALTAVRYYTKEPFHLIIGAKVTAKRAGIILHIFERSDRNFVESRNLNYLRENNKELQQSKPSLNKTKSNMSESTFNSPASRGSGRSEKI